MSPDRGRWSCPRSRRGRSGGVAAAPPCPVFRGGACRTPSPPPCPLPRRPARTHHAAAGGPGSPGNSVRRGSAQASGCCNPLRSALLYVGGACCRLAPLHLGIFAWRAGVRTSRASGAYSGAFSAAGEPQSAGGWGCFPSAGREAGGVLPSCVQEVWALAISGDMRCLATRLRSGACTVASTLLSHQLFCTAGSLGSGDRHPKITWASRAGERRRNTGQALELRVPPNPSLPSAFQQPPTEVALPSWWGQVSSATHLHETEYHHDKSGLLAQLPKKGSLQPICCQ